jgi:hypothetical protein
MVPVDEKLIREAYELGRSQWCPAGILKDEERTERDWQEARIKLGLAALHPTQHAGE